MNERGDGHALAMSDEATFDDRDDPLEHIEPDDGDADDVEQAWERDDPMDDEAPSG